MTSDMDMIFPDIKTQAIQLNAKYIQGGITFAKLEKELFNLMVLDENNIWWAIGINTFNWYFYNSVNSKWILEGNHDSDNTSD